MYHVKRSDRTTESALVETLKVLATDRRCALSVKDSGAVRSGSTTRPQQREQQRRPWPAPKGRIGLRRFIESSAPVRPWTA